ncbi:hypothetical protein F4819DRAFT_477821 [Hypoxylon fuscum]|nr:hypothetical protein F4819DRAFT_477821 [Hypoxylon fuscum]
MSEAVRVQGFGSPSPGWERVKEVVDQFLADAVKKSGVQAMALTSMPGTGKSTELIRHIWDTVKAGDASSKLVYVVSSDTEARLIRDWLTTTGGVSHEEASLDPREGMPITVCSVRECLPLLRQKAWDANRTVVFDVNWYATVEDEMAFGHLMSWAKNLKEKAAGGEHIHLAIVVLMSVFESRRTVEALEKNLGHITRLDCTDYVEFPYPMLQIELIDDKWAENAGEFVRIILGGRRILLATDSWMDLEDNIDPLFYDLMVCVPSTKDSPRDRPRNDSRNLAEANIVVLDSQIPYSSKMKRLGLFLSSGMVASRPVLVTELMQVVVKDRRLLQCEILRQQSWIWKSVGRDLSEEPPLALFLCAAGVEDLRSREESSELLGPAWNRDFMILVLASFQSWPYQHVNHNPMRPPASHFLWVEAMHRLVMLKCIQGRGDGTYACTELGDTIMDLYWAQEDPSYDFHVLYLLSRTKLKTHSLPVSRVLVRIAALAHVGFRELYRYYTELGVEALRRCAPPLTRDRAHAGAIWMGLGIHLLCEAKDWYEGRAEDQWKPVDGVRARCSTSRKVNQEVAKLESYLGLPPAQNHDWIYEPLTRDELGMIDQELMWAWLHRIAFFKERESPSGVDIAVDCVSLADMGVVTRAEPLHSESIRNYCKEVTTGKGVFFACYLSLEGDSNKKLHGKDLTWIPPEAFQEIPKETGLTWPQVVHKTYE